MPTRIEIINTYPGLQFRAAAVRQLVQSVLKDENLHAHSLTVILVDDPYLKQLHRDFLNDDAVTDVMTFDLGEAGQVEGEIYISGDRAKDHAAVFEVPLAEEIARLIIHGILHLRGYEDHTPQEQALMREQEDRYLHKYSRKIAEFLL